MPYRKRLKNIALVLHAAEKDLLAKKLWNSIYSTL
jgi:hypothetical protein